jgi:hypothetical protein
MGLLVIRAVKTAPTGLHDVERFSSVSHLADCRPRRPVVSCGLITP